jgi:hypothetical protein
MLSMPLNCIQSHHIQSAPRQTRAILRRKRGAEVLHRAYKWSLILQAMKPRLPQIYLSAEIHRQIDHNEMLRLAHSTKLLRDAEHIACHERRKRSCTSGGSSPRPGFAQCPYSTDRLEANQLKQVPWPPSAAYAACPPSDGLYMALDLWQVPKVPTRASAAAAPPVKLPASDLLAAIVKVVFWHPSRKSCVLSVACNTAGSGWSQTHSRASHPSTFKASPANSGAERLHISEPASAYVYVLKIACYIACIGGIHMHTYIRYICIL